jgi:hypothetical protein
MPRYPVKKRVVRKKKKVGTSYTKKFLGAGLSAAGGAAGRYALDALLAAAGGAIAGPAGAAAGGYLRTGINAARHYGGRGLGNLGRALSGFGDYTPSGFAVKRNTISDGNSPPSIVNSKNKNVIVRHREYLGDIHTNSSSAGEFQIQGFQIQPADGATFPWLSTIAQNFEQYRLRGMVFETKSTSANALGSTNTALGSIMMATQYDSLRPPFANEQQMLNHQWSTSARQSQSIIHAIECAAHDNVLSELYTRSGQLPEGADLRMYDFGTLYVATIGSQATNVNIAQLWCTYEIELITPQINSDSLAGQGSAWYTFANSAGVLTGAIPFGTFDSSLQANNHNTLDVVFDYEITTTGGVFFPDTVPAGTYAVTYVVIQGSPSAITLPKFDSWDENCIVSDLSNDNDNDPTFTNLFGPTNATSNSRACKTFIVTLLQPVVGMYRGFYVTAEHIGIHPNGQSAAMLITPMQGGMATADTAPYVIPPYNVSMHTSLQEDDSDSDDEESLEHLLMRHFSKKAKKGPKVEQIEEEDEKGAKDTDGFLYGKYTPAELLTIAQAMVQKEKDEAEKAALEAQKPVDRSEEIRKMVEEIMARKPPSA